jgi:muconate cycloisomerase
MARPSDIFGRTIRRHNLITNPLAAEGGFIAVPKGPGLGVELDRDALDRHTVRRFTVEMAG